MKKEKLSKKKLKNLRNMLFVKRTYYKSEFTTQIKDYFYHTIKQITLVRRLTNYGDNESFLYWECPELGGGTAGLKYWVNLEKTQDKKEVYHENP